MKSLQSPLLVSLLIHLGLIVACGIVFRSVQQWGAGEVLEEVSWIELSAPRVIPATAVIPAQAGIQNLRKVEKSLKTNLDSSARGGLAAPQSSHEAGMTRYGSGKSSNELLQQIRQRISRAKRYPMMAKEQGLEGVVTLLFSIDPEGKLSQARVTQTSGSSLLDQAALDTLKRATPFPSYEKPIQLSLKYDLNETE